MANAKLISVVTPCYNEEENVGEVYRQVKAVFAGLPGYAYEHIFIDNASTDRTAALVKEIIAQDPNIRLIVNTRNFGQVRSPYHGMLQGRGEAIISMAGDLQDPPELIREFIRKWEEGYQIVIGVKTQSRENLGMALVRKAFYHLISRISETEQVKNYSGFGLYHRQFLDTLRHLQEPYPYFRGLIAEFGFRRAEIPYQQKKREKGLTKNNLYTLYDVAMLGFVNHSKVPLRLASFLGFAVAIVSFIIALGYLAYKILFWNKFQLGISPIVIGLFFFGGVQLFFLGIIGEYIGAIFTQVKNHPLVIEKERVNF